MVSVRDLQDIANVMRKDVLISTTKAGSGHPTSCMSCAEIMSVLFFHEMIYDVRDPHNNNNDEFILSKGHAAPILYSALFRAGAVKGDLNNLRKFGSKFEGHPIPDSFPWAKVATGSLGQGLSVGVGMALAARIDGRSYQTYVLLGDSEMSEGSNYEAMQLASHYKLDNLTAIVDVNRLGQRGETMLGHDLGSYKKRWAAFGWEVHVIDGHDIKQIINALSKSSKGPKVILAKTVKGKGFNYLENKNGWHGKALDLNLLKLALRKFESASMPKVKIEKPKKFVKKGRKDEVEFSKYHKGHLIATRKAYGNILTNIGRSDSRSLVLDAEVSNSTYSNRMKLANPKQFIECFIAEQNMVGMALGLSKKGYNVFASSFAAFLTRAHDQLRMAAFSSPDIVVCGSHVGVSIGPDGGSQMGLGDISMFRNLPNSIVLYPSDAVSCEKLTVLASRSRGLKYIRTTRKDTQIIYGKKEKFKLGDFKVLKEGKEVVLVGSGVTLHECLAASEKIKGASVVDLYCIKPFDSEKFIEFVKKHGKKVVVVEDHFKEGGIGEMISEILVGTDIKMKHLCIDQIPRSGDGDRLMSHYGIDSVGIINAARRKF